MEIWSSKHMCNNEQKAVLNRWGFAIWFFFALCVSVGMQTQAQSVGVNNAGLSPDASAVLDINAAPANNKGFLLPQLTNGQRDAIAAPANGLMLFNQSTGRLNYWNGSQWIECNVSAISYTNPAGSNAGPGVCINISGQAPHHSALLEVYGATGGVLMPRMTAIQRNAISGPTAGLLVYNLSTLRLNYYNGSQWVELCGAAVSSSTGSVSNIMNVAIGNTIADPSSLLDVVSITKGMLIPRLTTAQRNAVLSPATGLMIFNTSTASLNIYIGSNAWIDLYPGAGIGAAGAITGSTSVCSGQAGVTYSIGAVSGATTYNWTVPSGSSITSGQGATSITVTLGSNSGNVTVTPGNDCGTGTPSSLAVTVLLAPVISSHPANSPILCEGNNTSFSVTATGSGLTYQWQVSTDGGVTYNDINLAGSNPTYSNWTTTTLGLSGVVLTNNGYRYRCVVSGSCAPSSTSNAAILTVDNCSSPPSAPVVSGNNCPIWAWDCPPSWIFTINNTGAAYYEMYIVASPGAPAFCSSTGTISGIAAGTYNYCNLLTSSGKPCCRWPGNCGTTGYICSVQFRACNGPGNCSAWTNLSSGCIANYSDDNCAFTDFSK
jgi:hypothetical protein